MNTSPRSTRRRDAALRWRSVAGLSALAFGILVAPAPARAASYTYDGAGRVVGVNAPNGTTSYSYDGEGNLVGETSPTGSRELVTSADGDFPEVLGDVSSGTTTVYEGSGAVIRAGAGAPTYALSDRLGSVRGYVTAAGAVAERNGYDAYGSRRAGTSRFGFTGEPHLANGLVYLRARAFQPSEGRFLTRDDFAGVADRPQSLNRYAYAENRPTAFSDPSGHAIQFGPLVLAGLLLAGGLGPSTLAGLGKRCEANRLAGVADPLMPLLGAAGPRRGVPRPAPPGPPMRERPRIPRFTDGVGPEHGGFLPGLNGRSRWDQPIYSTNANDSRGDNYGLSADGSIFPYSDIKTRGLRYGLNLDAPNFEGPAGLNYVPDGPGAGAMKNVLRQMQDSIRDQGFDMAQMTGIERMQNNPALQRYAQENPSRPDGYGLIPRPNTQRRFPVESPYGPVEPQPYFPAYINGPRPAGAAGNNDGCGCP